MRYVRLLRANGISGVFCSNTDGISRSIAADEQPEVTAFGDDAAAVSSVFDGSWTDVSSQLVVEVGVLSAGSLACFSAHSTVSARSG